jgi:hypothetical protein
MDKIKRLTSNEAKFTLRLIVGISFLVFTYVLFDYIAIDYYNEFRKYLLLVPFSIIIIYLWYKSVVKINIDYYYSETINGQIIYYSIFSILVVIALTVFFDQLIAEIRDIPLNKVEHELKSIISLIILILFAYTSSCESFNKLTN